MIPVRSKILNNCDSIINLTNLIIIDIESDKKINGYELEALNNLLTFEDSRLLNKYYFMGAFLPMKFKLIRIRAKAINTIKKYYGVYY